MAAFVYYKNERLRHPVLSATKIERSVALDIVRAMCEDAGVPTVKVEFFKGRGTGGAWSWFRWRYLYSGKYDTGVFLNTKTGISALVVVHEVAHYLHFMGYVGAMSKARAENRMFKRPRSHGPEHEALVNAGAKLVVAKGLLPAEALAQLKPAEVPPVAPVAVVEAPKPVAAPVNGPSAAEVWWSALNPDQCCSRCGQTKHKDRFGMRVVAKDSKGVGIKFARQGYCSDCRKEYVAQKKALDNQRLAA
jgi:hypothetical protein